MKKGMLVFALLLLLPGLSQARRSIIRAEVVVRAIP